MTTYKLLRLKNGQLYPLYVLSDQPLQIGVWLKARVGELADSGHVYSRTGVLSLRPGYHSTLVPFTDWIGARGADGQLYQRPDTVWTECEVRGQEITVTDRWGLRTIPDGWYRMRLNSKQKDPWIISGELKINRILTRSEVEAICREHGGTAQPVWEID